ncbi:MAG: hypothetical protein AAFR96_12290 [Planctomycetota bacterium]
METDVFKLKKRLWQHEGPPMDLLLVQKKKGQWVTTEIVHGPNQEGDDE